MSSAARALSSWLPKTLIRSVRPLSARSLPKSRKARRTENLAAASALQLCRVCARRESCCWSPGSDVSTASDRQKPRKRHRCLASLQLVCGPIYPIGLTAIGNASCDCGLWLETPCDCRRRPGCGGVRHADRPVLSDSGGFGPRRGEGGNPGGHRPRSGAGRRHLAVAVSVRQRALPQRTPRQ